MVAEAEIPGEQTLPLLEPTTKMESTLQVTSSSTPLPPGWLHTNLRNLLAIGITTMVCWLAWAGEVQARAGLVAAFSVLVGMIWGERAALKVPGKSE